MCKALSCADSGVGSDGGRSADGRNGRHMQFGIAQNLLRRTIRFNLHGERHEPTPKEVPFEQDGQKGKQRPNDPAVALSGL